MKSRFKLPPGSPPSSLKPIDFAPAPIGGEAITRPQVVTYLNSHPAATKLAAMTRLMKRLGSGRFAQGFLKTPPIRQSDPFILLLLADQELDGGRKEQARYLIEAAYEAYDQQKEPCVYTIYPVG
jgi:hypothetical protein